MYDVFQQTTARGDMSTSPEKDAGALSRRAGIVERSGLAPGRTVLFKGFQETIEEITPLQFVRLQGMDRPVHPAHIQPLS